MACLFHFPLLGEPLAVDLMNTRVRRNEVDLDLLDAPSALLAWLRSESMRLAWLSPVDAADLQVAQGLHAALAVLLVARRTDTRPGAGTLRRLNAALFVPTATARPACAAARPTAICKRGALLHTLEADAAAVLTGPSASLRPECARPDCVPQFVAGNPRRRWRSASVRGNRARMARHYLRQRADY